MKEILKEKIPSKTSIKPVSTETSYKCIAPTLSHFLHEAAEALTTSSSEVAVEKNAACHTPRPPKMLNLR
jgi:hypothetical protein